VVSFGAGGGASRGWSSLVVGRAGEDGGVKVERPQPKARTYDLDASVGRRTLVDDDNVVLLTGSRTGVRIGSLTGGGG
jgi:hypothetical protein